MDIHQLTCHNSQNTSNRKRMFIMLIPSINYCILPMAQVSTSPELRSHMLSSISCECVVCSCCDEVTSVEEGIELGIIYNPNAPPLAQG